MKKSNKILNKKTVTIILNSKSKKRSNALSLYCLYQLKANEQKTNMIKTTKEECKKILNWGEDKIQGVRNLLKELKLIEDIRPHSKGISSQYFVKVN